MKKNLLKYFCRTLVLLIGCTILMFPKKTLAANNTDLDEEITAVIYERLNQELGAYKVTNSELFYPEDLLILRENGEYSFATEDELKLFNSYLVTLSDNAKELFLEKYAETATLNTNKKLLDRINNTKVISNINSVINKLGSNTLQESDKTSTNKNINKEVSLYTIYDKITGKKVIIGIIFVLTLIISYLGFCPTLMACISAIELVPTLILIVCAIPNSEIGIIYFVSSLILECYFLKAICTDKSVDVMLMLFMCVLNFGLMAIIQDILCIYCSIAGCSAYLSCLHMDKNEDSRYRGY